jgi:hypothetical protein
MTEADESASTGQDRIRTVGFCYFVVGLAYEVRRGRTGIYEQLCGRGGRIWSGDGPNNGHGDVTFYIVHLEHYRLLIRDTKQTQCTDLFLT